MIFTKSTGQQHLKISLCLNEFIVIFFKTNIRQIRHNGNQLIAAQGKQLVDLKSKLIPITLNLVKLLFCNINQTTTDTHGLIPLFGFPVDNARFFSNIH